MVKLNAYTKEIVDVLQQDWKEGMTLLQWVLQNPGDRAYRKKLREAERKHKQRKGHILKRHIHSVGGHRARDCQRLLPHEPWDAECRFELAGLLWGDRAVAKWIYTDVEGVVRENGDG